jgi:hypothetical protein
MDTEFKVDEWKSGTDALAMCMICGGEYATDMQVCPDCNVSLSMVRRCPGCKRIVSFQHTKCVYCHLPFTNEAPKSLFSNDIVPELPLAENQMQRRFRAAAVSIVTFIVVFVAGIAFMGRMNRPSNPVHVVAKTYALRATTLRRAPSLSSSTVDNIASGTTLKIAGIPEGEHHERWMTLQWKDGVAYLPVIDLAPPKALSVDGAAVLKFYLIGMNNTEVTDEAVKAVNYYSQAFPGDVHGDELRWVLA